MTISFVGGTAKPLVSARSNRAYAFVSVRDASGTVVGNYNCLVDTGSDYTLLPDSLLPVLGLTPSSLITFRTAGGTSYTLPYEPPPPTGAGIRLVIEGVPKRLGVAFYSSGFTPILGRIEALSTFDIGFDNTNWFYG